MSPTFGEHFTSDLPRTPLGRSSQHSTSRHSGEAFSTAPHPPKFGHIGQTFNARGFAYANCCTLQPLVARQCPGGGFGIVYCCPTAAKTSIIPLGPFIFLRDLQKKQRADERTRTADLISLRVIYLALQGFAEACKCRIYKPLSFLRIAACCTVLRSRWYQSGINSTLASEWHVLPRLVHSGPIEPLFPYRPDGARTTSCPYLR